MNAKAPHLLIVESRFYKDLATALLDGAISVLDASGATYEIITVPGALEIPLAISMATQNFAMELIVEEDAEEDNRISHLQSDYNGYIALGTIIRGETYHFEIVAHESCRALMDLSIHYSLPLGNGILTVENVEQAWARADKSKGDKGGFAARTALTMIKHQENFAHKNFGRYKVFNESRH